MTEGSNVKAVDGDGETAESWAMKKGAKKSAATLRAAAMHPEQFSRAVMTASASPLWFVLGMVGILYATLLWITQPFYVSWPVIFGTQLLLRNRIKHMFPGATTHKSPMWVGIFTGLYVLSSFVYFTRILPDFQSELHPIAGWTHVVFILTNFLFVPLYYALGFMDPGVVPKTEQNDIRAFVADVRSLAPSVPAPSPPSAFADCLSPSSQYCVTCGLLRPLRAKHCRACDRCCGKMGKLFDLF